MNLYIQLNYFKSKRYDEKCLHILTANLEARDLKNNFHSIKIKMQKYENALCSALISC